MGASASLKKKKLIFLSSPGEGGGKTTIMYRLVLNKIVTTIPTIGFNVETLRYKGYEFTMWDTGGATKIAPLWKNYFPGMDGVIYVVNPFPSYIEESRIFLQKFMKDEDLRGCPFLIFANKQDLADAMSVEKVTEELGLNDSNTNNWRVFGCVGRDGKGLHEGLDWLISIFEQGDAAP